MATYKTPKPYKKPMGNGYDGSDTETLKDESCMVVGNVAANKPPGVKTSGIQMRGAGAATKGKMCRGPMA